jgi:hypothetical protein
MNIRRLILLIEIIETTTITVTQQGATNFETQNHSADEPVDFTGKRRMWRRKRRATYVQPPDPDVPADSVPHPDSGDGDAPD